jgi:hypothetical protein
MHLTYDSHDTWNQCSGVKIPALKLKVDSWRSFVNLQETNSETMLQQAYVH